MYNINKEKVRKIMKEKGINTQQELAERLDISKNQLSMLLSPSFNPIKSNAIKLCDELNVSFEDIIDSEQIEMDLGTSYHSEDNIKNIDRFAYEVKDSIDIRGVTANRNYTVLELFAGAGGLALGLEQAGFKSKGLVEYDKYACQTLRYNRPDWNVIHKDIVEVAEQGIKQFTDIPIGELDLLSGGYPCQTFSYAGNKLGLSDARGTLFYHYAQILKQLLPKTFVAENVRGLVNHDDGITLSLMLKVFSDIGYKVKWKVLKALDYEVAQKRERIVIVGIRNDLAEKYDLEYLMPKPYETTLTLKDILKDVPKSEGARYPEKKKQVLDYVPPGGYWRDLPDAMAKNTWGKAITQEEAVLVWLEDYPGMNLV